jgi:hypothetical protein
MSSQSVYRTYRFIDKDPIIDKVRTVLQDEGLFAKGKRKIVHELSGVQLSTLDGWFEGDTMKPINATVGAVISSIGYEMTFIKSKDINIDKELKVAANWLLRQNSTKAKPKKRVNGHK